MGHGSSIDSPAPPDDERVELATPLLKSRPGGTWSSRQFKLSVVATGGAPEHHLSWRPLADEARTKTIRLRPRHFELTVRSTPCALHRLAHSGEFVRADSVGDASGLEVEAAFIPAAEPDEPQGEFSITVNEEFTLNLRAADVDTLTRWLSALHAINPVAAGGRHALGEHADEHADAADGASVFEYRVSAKRWEPFSDAECERIAAAVASEPNGRIALGKSQEIRFGNAATSDQMPIPPTTGLVQVDDRTGSTQIVRRRPRSSSPPRAAASSGATEHSSPAGAASGPRRCRRLTRVGAGEWRLGNQIGEGSYSTVFIGMCKATGQLIAIKRMRMPSSEAKVAELKNEVEIMRELVHQNIVRYLGVERVADSVYVLEEWVPGGSVASLVAQFGPLPDSVTREYTVQALRGLVYLHSHDLIHRDVKGANMLVTDDGILKLADFGSCKRLAHAPLGQPEEEGQSAHVGTTPYFMAPEIMARHPAEFKSDVWSLGGAALEMATGSPPWKGQNFAAPAQLFEHVKALVAETGSAVPPIGAAVSHEVSGMLRRCFESDVSRRPTALELLRTEPFLRLLTYDGAPERTCAAEVSEEPRASPDDEGALEFTHSGSGAPSKGADAAPVKGTSAGTVPVPNLNATPAEAEQTPPAAAGPSKESVVRFADGAALKARPPEQPNPFASRGRRVSKAGGAVSESASSAQSSSAGAQSRANRGANASSAGQSSRPGPPRRKPALEAALKHQVIP